MSRRGSLRKQDRFLYLCKFKIIASNVGERQYGRDDEEGVRSLVYSLLGSVKIARFPPVNAVTTGASSSRC